MGNTASCTPYPNSTGSIKVITTDGAAEDYLVPIRAAELMADNPGQFVCDSIHLNVACRIPGLTADEDLQRHHLYFLLPMDMLYSVLTDEEMAILSCRASGAARRRRATAKNLVSIFCLSPVAAQDMCVEEPMIVVKEGERVAWRRSWRPELDTIEEVP